MKHLYEKGFQSSCTVSTSNSILDVQLILFIKNYYNRNPNCWLDPMPEPQQPKKHFIGLFPLLILVGFVGWLGFLVFDWLFFWAIWGFVWLFDCGGGFCAWGFFCLFLFFICLLGLGFFLIISCPLMLYPSC